VLKLLLDEHISPAVAAGVRRRSPRMIVHALAEWRGGEMIGQDDETILTAAAKERLTLVTYDRRTIPPLLKVWAEEGRRYGGVIFVDEKTISPADIGGLTRALLKLDKISQRWKWMDRVVFLGR
jgi:hypothetical protein